MLATSERVSDKWTHPVVLNVWVFSAKVVVKILQTVIQNS